MILISFVKIVCPWRGAEGYVHGVWGHVVLSKLGVNVVKEDEQVLGTYFVPGLEE